MTIKYILNKSSFSPNKISKSDYQKLSTYRKIHILPQLIKDSEKRFEYVRDRIESPAVRNFKNIDIGANSAWSQVSKQTDALSAFRDSLSGANSAWSQVSKQTDALNAFLDSLSEANSAWSQVSKQTDAMSAFRDSLSGASSAWSQVSKQTDVMSAFRDSLSGVNSTWSQVSKQTDAMNAFRDSLSGANSAWSQVSKQMENMRVLQDRWNGSFKTIIANLDENYKDYRNKQYALIAKAQEYQWFLNEELVDRCIEEQIEIEDTVFDEDKVVKHIKERFDEYINDIVTSPCYATQKKIINQSVYAYTIGHYEMAIFPLLGSFDNVISRWAQGILTNPYQHQDVYIYNFRGKLKNHIGKSTKVVENIQSINLLSGLTIINAYIDLFDNRPSDLTKINRNAILHGSFNYDVLSQNSYLKMIVLLKSALALLDVSPSELNIEISVENSKQT